MSLCCFENLVLQQNFSADNGFISERWTHPQVSRGPWLCLMWWRAPCLSRQQRTVGASGWQRCLSLVGVWETRLTNILQPRLFSMTWCWLVCLCLIVKFHEGCSWESSSWGRLISGMQFVWFIEHNKREYVMWRGMTAHKTDAARQGSK